MTDVTTIAEAPQNAASRPRLIQRTVASDIERHLETFGCALLTGPYEVGKSTVVTALAARLGATPLNPNAPDFGAVIADLLREGAGNLIVIDEIQDAPDTLNRIRRELDRWHNERVTIARFLLTSSRPLDAKRLVDERLPTLAREFSVAPITLTEYTAAWSSFPTSTAQAAPLDIEAVSVIATPSPHQLMEKLWLRGGYPRSLLAASTQLSHDWRDAYLRALCNRGTVDQRPDYPSTAALDLLRAIAFNKGSHKTLEGRPKSDYAHYLVRLGILRLLPQWDRNIERRNRTARKAYFCDTGLLHCLLQNHYISDLKSGDLGYSWESFCLQQLISAAPNATAYYYRDGQQNEIDLVLEFSPRSVLAIEIKCAGQYPQKGFYAALEALQPARGFVVKPSPDPDYKGSVRILSLAAMINEVQSTAAQAYAPDPPTPNT